MKINQLKSGLLALALGLGLVFTQSAFVKGNRVGDNRQTFTFYYHGPDYAESNVENEAYWSVTPSEDVCDGDAKACQITIDREYVNNPDTAPTLSSTANLDGSSSLTLSKVIGSDDSNMTIQNTRQ